jgi:hypothetical protein
MACPFWNEITSVSFHFGFQAQPVLPFESVPFGPFTEWATIPMAGLTGMDNDPLADGLATVRFRKLFVRT